MNDDMNKDDIEFELKWKFGHMPHNPENCKMCGYCTGEVGTFSFDCLGD